MGKPRPSVSIVIPAYNEERHLWQCLQAVAAQTSPVHEVVVVDNNSTDRTRAVAEAFPFARVVAEPRQGRVFARDAGFDAASGEIIGRIDADIVLPPGWVDHVQTFYSDSAHASRAWSGGGFFYNVRLPRLVSWAYNLFAFRLNKLLTGHYTLWGSNMAMTRKQWQAVRGQVCDRLDIHEDLDVTLHLVRAGYDSYYDPTIKTQAELRRVHTNRHQLWEYLQWWPRTLRLHGYYTWVLCWFFGAFCLYLATFILVAADKLARAFRRQLPLGQTSTEE